MCAVKGEFIDSWRAIASQQLTDTLKAPNRYNPLSCVPFLLESSRPAVRCCQIATVFYIAIKDFVHFDLVILASDSEPDT